jgi:hypothetical protein
MDEQKNNSTPKLDQDRIGVWIGVTILILVGIGIMIYGIYLATNPGATMMILP